MPETITQVATACQLLTGSLLEQAAAIAVSCSYRILILYRTPWIGIYYFTCLFIALLSLSCCMFFIVN